MITLKSEKEIAAMYESGQLLGQVHQELKKIITPGITSWDIEIFVREFLEKHHAIPAQMNNEGYEYATCVSINDEICHGFPRKEILKQGDLIKVDMCVNLNGAMSDSCWAYGVGEVSPEVEKLMSVTKKALYLGINEAKIGKRIGDIGFKIQEYVEGEKLSVVRDFVGHGIGPRIHEEPAIPHFGKRGTGSILREGMVITVEPMVNLGTYHTVLAKNGWTAKTKDGKLSCQYEHTVAITKDGPKILTSQGIEETY